jgi:hypothetical protein
VIAEFKNNNFGRATAREAYKALKDKHPELARGQGDTDDKLAKDGRLGPDAKRKHRNTKWNETDEDFGEMVALDERGRSDFAAVKGAIGLGGRGLVFVAFDLVFLDGKDLSGAPIEERGGTSCGAFCRARQNRRLQFSEAIARDGADVFASAEQLGCAAAVGLRAASTERPAQSVLGP